MKTTNERIEKVVLLNDIIQQLEKRQSKEIDYLEKELEVVNAKELISGQNNDSEYNSRAFYYKKAMNDSMNIIQEQIEALILEEWEEMKR